MNLFSRRGTNLDQAMNHLAELIERREHDGVTWQRAVQAVYKKS